MLTEEQDKTDWHMSWDGHEDCSSDGTDTHRILALHWSNVSQR